MLRDKEGAVMESNVTFHSDGKEAKPGRRQGGKWSKQRNAFAGGTGDGKEPLRLETRTISCGQRGEWKHSKLCDLQDPVQNEHVAPCSKSRKRCH